ncbi:MAG: acyltransferase [Actinobacteria bacterium]|nr:acyltransferase [Actinomycetota bacterium]
MSTPTAGTPVPAANPGHLAYLPGLDGLRALSVLAVIVYHANKSWLGGGFLGVEVFFVISGYLITTLLLNESERTGSISLRQFWIRRARRLLPALWTMLVMVVLWCAAFEREALGQLRGDVVAAVLYGFNWFQVWMGTSYFGQLGLVPLRHLWSLAVEEQFYLVWPVLIAVLLRVVGRRSWLLDGARDPGALPQPLRPAGVAPRLPLPRHARPRRRPVHRCVARVLVPTVALRDDSSPRAAGVRLDGGHGGARRAGLPDGDDA